MQVSEFNHQLPKFLVAAVLFFAWGTVQGALQAQQPVHDFLQQGPAAIIVGAHTHIGTLGWVSLPLFAVIYYLAPILSGKPIAWQGFIDWLFWLWVIALAVMAALMIMVGVLAGSAFAVGVRGPGLDALMAPYMIAIALLGILLAVLALLFVVQVLVSLNRTAK